MFFGYIIIKEPRAARPGAMDRQRAPGGRWTCKYTIKKVPIKVIIP